MINNIIDLFKVSVLSLGLVFAMFIVPQALTTASGFSLSLGENTTSGDLEDTVSVDADLSATGNIAVDQCVEVPETPGTAVCVCSGSLNCPPDPATCVEIPPTAGSTVCVSTSCESSSQTSTSPGAENIEPPFDGCNLAQSVSTFSDASCSIVATSNGDVLVDRVIETGQLGDTLEVCVDIQGQ